MAILSSIGTFWNRSVQDFSLHQSLMKLCAKWQEKFWIVLNIMNCSLCFGRTSFSEIYLFSFNYRAWKLFYCLTKVQRISFHPCKLDYLVRTICFLIMNYFSYVLYFRLISKTKSCFLNPCRREWAKTGISSGIFWTYSNCRSLKLIPPIFAKIDKGGPC